MASGEGVKHGVPLSAPQEHLDSAGALCLLPSLVCCGSAAFCQACRCKGAHHANMETSTTKTPCLHGGPKCPSCNLSSS